MCPLVKIEIREGRSTEYKKAILDGVHEALVEALKIPDSDRFQRIYELKAEDFEVPQDRTDQAIIIEIKMFPGRSLDAKKNLYHHIIRNLKEDPGIDGHDVVIILLEPPLTNWGVRGGQPASAVDLGFDLEV
jgi:phenylpyruvate tautomerase PptA (4-oxalocrotonate tautomerase family)